VIEHERGDEIEVVAATIADDHGGIERHGRIAVAPEVHVIGRSLHLHVDGDDTTRNLQRGSLRSSSMLSKTLSGALGTNLISGFFTSSGISFSYGLQ